MLINIKVKPNAKESKIEQKDGAYIVYVKASPQDNKANIELLKFLSKHFSAKIKIIRGLKSKNKVIEVSKEEY